MVLADGLVFRMFAVCLFAAAAGRRPVVCCDIFFAAVADVAAMKLELLTWLID